MSPLKPTDNLPRVDRGGAWDSHVAAWVRAAARFAIAPAVRNDILGFRCALRGCRQQVLKGGVTP